MIFWRAFPSFVKTHLSRMASFNKLLFGQDAKRYLSLPEVLVKLMKQPRWEEDDQDEE